MIKSWLTNRYLFVLSCLLFSQLTQANLLEFCQTPGCKPPIIFLTEHSLPGTYLDEQGRPAGVTVQLLQTLSQQLQQDGVYYLMPWARAFQKAQVMPRTVLFETVRNSEREALFKWVGPVKFFDMQLYGPTELAGLGLNSQQLSQRFIACGYRGASYHQALETMGFNEEHNLILMSKAGDCIDMLKLGRAELTPLNILRHGPHFRQAGLDLSPLLPIRKVELYLAFSLDFSDEEVASWQHQLQLLSQNGTLRALYSGTFSEQLISLLEQRLQPENLTLSH